MVAKSGCVYEHSRRLAGKHTWQRACDGGCSGREGKKNCPPRAGPSPFAAAVATNIANHSPEVAAKTAAFFEEQTELVKAQRKSVEAEHEYFELEWGPRLLGIRLRTGFQIFFALFATVIGIYRDPRCHQVTQCRDRSL